MSIQELESLRKERDQLKDENERLKEDCNKLIAGNAKLRGQLSSNADQFAYVAKQRDQLRDLNRELLEALKDMYMDVYGGNSKTVEEAMSRSPKTRSDFEQKIISLIQKAS